MKKRSIAPIPILFSILEFIMKKRILPIIMVAVLLTGCADTPDEVRNDMSSYRDLQSSVSDADFKFSYIKVSDLQDDAETALEKNYGQFTVSDKIKFIQPDSVNIMEFSCISGFIDKSKEVMSCFFPESVIASQDIKISDNFFTFMNEKEKVYFGVEDCGFIAMLNPETFDISFSYSEPVVKIYHTNRNDDLSDEYELNNGTCSVADAVNYINDWLYTEYKTLSPELDYIVNTVIVREHNNKYLFQFLVEGAYKGVPLDSFTRKGEIKDGMPTGKMKYIDYGIQIQMVNKKSIDSFTNLIGIFTPCIKENIDEVISLDSALAYCEKTFTDFKNVEISDVRIMYTLSPFYSVDKEILTVEDNAKVLGYSSRPVWEIILDVPPDDFLQKDQINTKGDVRKYIYIDMITGECYFSLDVNN